MVEAEQKALDRARELLQTVRHAAMATVNADGSPHNSPYYFLYEPSLKYLYWGTHPESQHTQNLLRTGQLFVVLYDAFERGGLYIQVENPEELSGESLQEALDINNKARARDGRPALGIKYYQESPQRMYRAVPTKFWTNTSERGSNGMIVKDYRFEITPEQLLQ